MKWACNEVSLLHVALEHWGTIKNLTFAVQKYQTNHHTERMVIELKPRAVPTESSQVMMHPYASQHHRQNTENLNGEHRYDEQYRRSCLSIQMGCHGQNTLRLLAYMEAIRFPQVSNSTEFQQICSGTGCWRCEGASQVPWPCRSKLSLAGRGR